MNPLVLTALAGLGGTVVGLLTVFNAMRGRQQTNEGSIMSSYDKLVGTLQAEIKRRDEMLAARDAEIAALHARIHSDGGQTRHRPVPRNP